MSGLALWISENVWTFLIIGLVLSTGLVGLAVRSFRRARQAMRSGAGSWKRMIAPLALLALGAGGLFYFGAGSVVMGPALVGQQRLLGKPAPDFG